MPIEETSTRGGAAIVPQAIEQADDAITIRWSDAQTCLYTAANLRRVCPCAQCVNEWTGERTLRAEIISDAVKIEDANLVGRYALTLRFSDKHETGIYSFRYLRELCETKDAPPNKLS